jgi:hypothetical protein
MVGPAQLNLKRYYLPSKRKGIGREDDDSGTVQVIDKATAKEAFRQLLSRLFPSGTSW